MLKDDIIGTWRAAGQRRIAADGSISHPMGDNHPGYLTYTADGHVVVVATSATNVPAKPVDELTIAEKAAAAEGCVAYFGRYDINGDDIFHHVEVAIFPAWAGKTRLRHAHLEGTRLTLIGAPNPDGSVDHIFWER